MMFANTHEKKKEDYIKMLYHVPKRLCSSSLV